MSRLWNIYKTKMTEIRPFLRTKIGTRLAILAAIDFVVLFFAPMLHGFVGVAIFGCVASVYLMLIWRKYDKAHAIVPAVILCLPMLLDMLFYVGHDQIGAIVVGYLIAIIAMLIATLTPSIGFFDNTNDTLATLVTAGVLCVVTVVLACIVLLLVRIAWWILCIIAFVIVVAVFLGVVFSTAAYTASDGRRQARKNRERRAFEQDGDPQPRRRDTKIYNLDEDDFTDIDDIDNG